MQVKQSLCLSRSKCSTRKRESKGKKSYLQCFISSPETPDTRKQPPSDLLKLSLPTDEIHFCKWLASDLEATDNLWSLKTGCEALPCEPKLQEAGKKSSQNGKFKREVPKVPNYFQQIFKASQCAFCINVNLNHQMVYSFYIIQSFKNK